MRAFRDFSIRTKLTLIIMVTSTVALLMSGAAFAVYDLYTFRRTKVSDLTILAEVLGSNSTAALTFNDPKSAKEILGALSAKKSIVAACIYTRDGRAFATYLRGRPEWGFSPPAVQADGSHFGSNQLVVFRKIMLQGEQIGTVYLQSDLLEIRKRLNRGAALLVVVVLGSSLVALLLSSKYQRAISDPIRNLAWMTKMVAVEKNYSIRAVKQSKDELGLFIEGFNAMLEQIQHRDAALQNARHDLERRVEERTRELQQEIAERKQAEKKLEERTTRLNALIENSPLAIVAADAQHRLTMCNRAFEQLFLYRQPEILGQELDQLVASGEIQAEAKEFTRREFAGETVHATTRRCRSDGTPVDVEVYGVPLLVDGELVGVFGLYQDITARKRAEEELQKAKEAAEAANRAKSEFLANMSHEIRTPMNGILGMTELALDTDLNPEQREYLRMVKTSADSLLRVINDVLDFSKIEAGKLDLEQLEFDLRATLGETLKTLAIRAHKKGLELPYQVQTNVPEILVGDPGRLQQLVVNLVGNAIKFTEHGEVAVRVQAESQTSDSICLHFIVQDTGIGISREKLDWVFEPFAQADGSMTRRHGGTGLGLPISKRLVELMGGRLWVESDLGQGSVFHFTASFALPETQQKQAHPAELETLENLRVLVVDDSATNRSILQDMLASWRMAPTAADGGRAGLRVMEEARDAGSPFPLVLLDARMPDMDGFAVAERIKRNSELAGATIMLLTSDRRRDDAARCRALGFAGHITKPISQSDLLDAILLALGRRRPATEPLHPATAPAPRIAQRSLRILLAEDNIVNQAVAIRMLEKGGHTVVVTTNGREALEALEECGFGGFEVVLLDAQMPEMDGFEATAAIRAREKALGKHIPIIAMTAHAFKGDRERCLAAGMDGYVSKPVRAKDLFEEIERCVRPAAEPAADTSVAQPQESLNKEALLECVEGDPELLTEMVRLFGQDSPGLLAALDEAVAHGDAKALERAAHTLKGVVSNFAAPSATAAALRLEQMAREGDLTRAGEALPALRQEIGRLNSILSRLCQEVVL